VMPKRACNCINSSALPWSRRLCHWAGAVPAPCTAWGSSAFADRVLRSARPSISELSGAVLGRGMSNWFASARRTAFRYSWCISFVCSSPLVGSVRPFPLRQGATRTGLCATQQDQPWGPFTSDVGGNSCGELVDSPPTSVAKGSSPNGDQAC
jgi:hypothetical protein